MNNKFKEYGEAGQMFHDYYCEQNNIPYQITSHKEDYTLGVDRKTYKEGYPTDVKNTVDIFCMRIDVESGKIYTRHPFRITSQATHYFLCEVKPGEIEKGKFLEFVGIRLRLERDFINNFEAFKTHLISLDQTLWNTHGKSLSQAAFQLKKQLAAFCKAGEKSVEYKFFNRENQIVADPKSNEIVTVSFKLRQNKTNFSSSSNSLIQKCLNQPQQVSQIKEIITITPEVPNG